MKRPAGATRRRGALSLWWLLSGWPALAGAQETPLLADGFELPAAADPLAGSAALREAVGADGIRATLRELERIADDNGGNRATGSAGYAASVDLLAALLGAAGYSVRRQIFDVAAAARLPAPGGKALHPEVAARSRAALAGAAGVTSTNLIVDTPGGRADRVVLAGAHLDSVVAGPGVQDNGSGSAALLEIALQLVRLGLAAAPANRVRFVWWGAEEQGLLGSRHYVASLDAAERATIMVNLNFDMLASPNYARFVYDGDGSDTPSGAWTLPASAAVERVFLDFFAARGLPADPAALEGRSDYAPFAAIGIPVGGLFSGAEDLKTAVQAARYGGQAGVAYDVCYHRACDRLDNVNPQALDEMTDAAAHAIWYFAMTPEPG